MLKPESQELPLTPVSHPPHFIGHKVPLIPAVRHHCVRWENVWGRSRVEAWFSSDTCERRLRERRLGQGRLRLWRRSNSASAGPAAVLKQKLPVTEIPREQKGQDPDMPLGLVFGGCWGRVSWAYKRRWTLSSAAVAVLQLHCKFWKGDGNSAPDWPPALLQSVHPDPSFSSQNPPRSPGLRYSGHWVSILVPLWSIPPAVWFSFGF